jgi:hypothetical protein
MDTKTSKEEVQSLFQTVLVRRRKRGVKPQSFEELKPIVVAILNNRSIYSLSKEMEVNYRTLHKRSKAALEYLDPENTDRELTEQDIQWLKQQIKNADQKANEQE